MVPCPGEAHAPGAAHVDSCALCAPLWGEVRVIYVCECEIEADATRDLFEVTSLEGARVVVRYCAGCAELAAMNWNGETASIRKLEGP